MDKTLVNADPRWPHGYVRDYDEATVQLMRTAVPAHLLPGLDAYVAQRVCPGDFLVAVLENNLREAVLRAADETTRRSLFGLVIYLSNCVPAPCWGSPTKVRDWLGGPG